MTQQSIGRRMIEKRIALHQSSGHHLQDEIYGQIDQWPMAQRLV